MDAFQFFLKITNVNKNFNVNMLNPICGKNENMLGVQICWEANMLEYSTGMFAFKIFVVLENFCMTVK